MKKKSKYVKDEEREKTYDIVRYKRTMLRE
jgi:hypothetical protein